MSNRYRAPYWKNTLRARIIALSFMVILVGAGSQILVNSLTASAKMLSVVVTTYHAEGRMADGNWAYTGACADSHGQFPYGTVIALYRGDGQFVRQCVIEDQLAGLPNGHIALAIPDGSNELGNWHQQTLTLQILHWGSNRSPASNLKISSLTFPRLSIARSPFEKNQIQLHKATLTCMTTATVKASGC